MLSRIATITTLALLGAVKAQQAGTLQAEVHPSLPVQKCTGSGSSATCTTLNTKIVLDSNWRWLHSTSGSTNCYTGSSWDATLCPDNKTCAANCALEGADYAGTYGITTSGNALSLKFVTGANVGSRVYLMADDTKYYMFKLKNQEFTFDVDMSTLGCGLNGALYLSEMAEDGGMSKYSGNKAGAKYGTGYCDAQCPHDIKFINGEANVEGWQPSATDPNAGGGKYGTCCPEMDIWEANSQGTAYTPHPCSVTGQYRCSGTECGDGSERYSSVCDKDGCDFNPWRMGDQSFIGTGKTIDTSKKITVVTQFITSDGTANGALTEIRRLWIQNGVVYQNPSAKFTGLTGNSLTNAFCDAQKTLFGDNNIFKARGGMAEMGDAMANGMVLSLSIWADHAAHMLWLDSNYPTDADPSKPGISRGPCPTSSGDPKDVQSQQPNATVVFSNIKFGDIGSTYSGTPAGSSSTTRTGTSTSTTRTSTTTTRTTTTSTSTATGALQTLWGQCGGQNWTGPTQCQPPATCKAVSPPWYYQCLN